MNSLSKNIEKTAPISLAASTHWRDCYPNAPPSTHSLVPSSSPPSSSELSSRPSSSLSFSSSPSSSLSSSTNIANHVSDTFFKHIRWTADGTTLISLSSTNALSTHVVPSTLLSSPRTSTLETHSTIALPSPTNIFQPAPYFSLDDPSTQLILVATKDSPIHLHHAYPPITSIPYPPLASYKLIRRETEAYLQPMSALWMYPGTHFLTGTMNRLDYFDTSRSGPSGPLLTIHTIPSRRHLSKGGGVGMKGMVSALDMSADNSPSGSLLAAGTWTRWISLYDIQRSTAATGTWCIKDVARKEFRLHAKTDGGSGIMQVKWSPCGRYLIINERQAGGLLVYDIRGTGRPLSFLPRLRDGTSQRVECDVYQNARGGFEIWAGDQQGGVSVWEDVAEQEGVVDRSWGWKAHDCAIGSTIMHGSGSVVATCGGGWEVVGDGEVAERRETHTSVTKSVGISGIRIWSIGDAVETGAETERDKVKSGCQDSFVENCQLRPAK